MRFRLVPVILIIASCVLFFLDCKHLSLPTVLNQPEAVEVLLNRGASKNAVNAAKGMKF